MNGRNDLDACWLIAHDARIPLSPAGNVKKRIACALDPKIIPDNIACRGKGEHWLCCVGCCYEVETPANACDTGRQTASYFVLGKLPRLGSCSSVDWQPQQSAASRFVGSETGVEKVKRKQLQRTGPQVYPWVACLLCSIVRTTRIAHSLQFRCWPLGWTNFRCQCVWCHGFAGTQCLDISFRSNILTLCWCYHSARCFSHIRDA